ncbi:MAG TPA: hypothetical protein VFC50_03435 [Candidatus Dormibacteraeota bacterium]|nr:hypothetical protein [Candidatus Dormibacteraeota bacterium]
MSDVLEDVFSSALSVVDRADTLRVAEHGRSTARRTIPGIDLEMDWSIEPIEGDPLSTTHLIARAGSDRVRLVSVSEGPEENIQRRSVKGYRGSELGGDYLLAVVGTGLIKCGLGGEGLRDAPSDDSEPLGKDQALPQRKLSELEPAKLSRLGIVTDGIRNNVAVARLIINGKTAEEALATIGRRP